ncbi:MAG: HXXEE domain-containing protein [Planctomycetota bacterium]
MSDADPPSPSRFVASIRRLPGAWMDAALPVGLLLLLLTFAFAPQASWWWIWVWLQLPVYMLHQWEEHAGDRFRNWVNLKVGRGATLLTPLDVAVINLIGVWCVFAVALLLAVWVQPGFGLIAAYCVLVNAAVHIIAGVKLRSYNPGLLTSVVLFVPVGGACIAELQRQGHGALAMHATGVGVAVAIHAAIVVTALRRKRA